jgi:hypothetical protein
MRSSQSSAFYHRSSAVPAALAGISGVRVELQPKLHDHFVEIVGPTIEKRAAQIEQDQVLANAVTGQVIRNGRKREASGI